MNATSDQALLEELRRHRAELRESMSALEDALAAPPTADPVRWSGHVHAALVELSGDLREHVALTEGPRGVYRDVLMTAPRLSGAVEGLTREHGLIGDQLDKLLGRLAGTDMVDPDEVRERGTLLLGRLVRHRQRGSDLLFEAYEFDIGGET